MMHGQKNIKIWDKIVRLNLCGSEYGPWIGFCEVDDEIPCCIGLAVNVFSWINISFRNDYM